MKTSRLIFTIAGIYGLLILTPFLFLERRLAEASPGGLTHPEYFYGFLGAALVMQLVYLVIGRDPLRFRPLMPIAALAKARILRNYPDPLSAGEGAGGGAGIRLGGRAARLRLPLRVADHPG